MNTVEISVATELPVVTPSILDPRVERGASLLDERMPGWAEKVNLERLDLDSPHACVLGQLGICVWKKRDYYETVSRLFGTFDSDALEMEHGFVAADFYHITDPDRQELALHRDWELLEAGWRLAILSRRTA